MLYRCGHRDRVGPIASMGWARRRESVEHARNRFRGYRRHGRRHRRHSVGGDRALARAELAKEPNETRPRTTSHHPLRQRTPEGEGMMRKMIRCLAMGLTTAMLVLFGTATARADEAATSDLKARFDYLSTHGNSNCSTAFLHS